MTRSQRSTLCVLAILTRPVSGSAAVDPLCLLGFASVSAVENLRAADLVANTYGALLDQLGPHLTPDTLNKMRASQNPFLIPEHAEGDSTALRKHVRGLELLVEAKRWRTPDVIKRLLTDLEARASRVDEANSKKSRSVRQNSDFDFSLPRGGRVAQSPDGRYFVSVNDSKDTFAISVFDTETGTTSIPATGSGTLRIPHFSRDGRELRFFVEPGVFGTVPFERGSVLWTKRKLIPVMTGNKLISGQSTGSDPDVFLAGVDAVAPEFLVNVKDQKVLPVNLDGVRTVDGRHNPALMLRGWGYIPESDRLYFRVRNGRQEASYVICKISPDGVITRESVLASFPLEFQDRSDRPDPMEVTFAHDGKKAYLYGTVGKEYLSVKAVDQPLRVLRTDSGRLGRPEIQSVVAHPTEPLIVLIISEQGANPPKVRAQFIDTRTDTVKADLPLPADVIRASFSPDGTQLNVFESNGAAKAISLHRIPR